MPEPFIQAESAPPIPVLGQAILDQGGEMERTWKNAPSIVRDARMLTIFGIFLNGLWILIGGLILATPEARTKEDGINTVYLVVSLLLCISLVVLLGWLIRGLRLGTKVVWTIELVLAIIGLPLYALISIYILYKWFQPETKRWFGVGS